MTHLAAIERAREAMRADGFKGEPGTVVGDHTEQGHHLRVVEYRFAHHDGDYTMLFVEAVEVHEGAREARIYPLSAAVHVLQNLGTWERFEIEARETRAGS